MATRTPLPPLAVKILLDVEHTIQYDRVAEYRMSTLPRPSSTKDFLDDQKSFGALVSWLWACMQGKGRVLFLTPEDLAPQITEDRCNECFEAFHKSWKAVQPPEEASPNAVSSTTGPLPAPSST